MKIKTNLSISISGIIFFLITINMGIFGIGVTSSEELKSFKKKVADIQSETAIGKYQVALKNNHEYLRLLSDDLGLSREIKPKILKSKSLAQIYHQ